MKILVNASNLHSGGAVQVATSAITEFASLKGYCSHVHVLASTEVDFNLRASRAELDCLGSYRVHNSFGLSAIWKDPFGLFNGYDAVFTVFGPLYSLRRPANCIVGFAQPWILYPDNEVSRRLSSTAKLVQRFKYWVQSRFFSRADLLVVELEHARRGLVRHGVATAEQVQVVHNSLSALYLNPSLWTEVEIPNVQADLRLGFLGRNYAHKNTAIFASVHALLKKKYGIDARFFVTFTEQEWTVCGDDFRAGAVNVGPLSVAQCPAFYQALDGVVFPSLLECFSATPLEAMAMERPLFASDRPFVRDVCGDHAHYFDPLDPATIADSIATYFRSKPVDTAALVAAREHAIHFSNPTERARQYMALICKTAGLPSPLEAK